MLPYKIGNLLTRYMLSPWWSLAEAEHDQNNTCSLRSKCSRPWLPTCPSLLVPTLSAFFWRAGRNHPPHCCISEHGLLSKPTHSLQKGKTIAHGTLFLVPVDRIRILPQFGLSFDIGCSALVGSCSMPSIWWSALLGGHSASKFFPKWCHVLGLKSALPNQQISVWEQLGMLT